MGMRRRETKLNQGNVCTEWIRGGVKVINEIALHLNFVWNCNHTAMKKGKDVSVSSGIRKRMAGREGDGVCVGWFMRQTNEIINCDNMQAIRC